MNSDLQEFLEVFLEEANEHVEAMEGALLEIESATDKSEILNTVFRAAHSIKGTSATLGLHTVAEFTHELESLLDRMRDGQVEATSEVTELLLESVDVLTGLLSATCDGSEEPENMAVMLVRLKELKGDNHSAAAAPAEQPVEQAVEKTAAAPTGDPAPASYDIVFRPPRDFFHLGLDPLILLRELGRLGTLSNVCIDESNLPSLNSMDPETCYLEWTLQLETTCTVEAIKELFMIVDDDTIVEVVPSESQPTAAAVKPADTEEQEESTESAAAVSAPSASASAATTPSKAAEPASEQPAPAAEKRAPAKSQSSGHRESVRVNGERLDDMINQIGELVIGISMVEEEWASLSPDVESSAIVQLSKIVRDLQEQSLSMRMVPIAATFQKMNRSVRDLSRKLGKQVSFIVSGEETELDKTVVDQIGDPLVHMIRNSVDHGIESPEDRVAAGKPPEGRISVRAYHQGGNIYIEMQDDGKGLNLDAIHRKAIDRGLVDPNANLTQQEICDLVFEAGLSTAQTISDVSGRGVGMDVVRRNVEELKGSVTIFSQPGVGTTVTVRLPLTLAILDGLLVRLGTEVYVVPLLSVVESFRPRKNELKRLANNMEVVQVRGEVVPVLHLHSILNMADAVTDPTQGLLVIVEDHDTKFALLVDDLLGQQQAVIKNLESNFHKVPGIAGATILGDGRVALILDVVGLRQLAPAAPPSLSRTGEVHDCS